MRFALLICTLFALSGCGSGKKKATDNDLPEPLRNFSAKSQRLTIMTWNLENLYDTEDDPKTKDDTYLPMALKKKIPNHFKNCEKLSAKSWQEQCKEWDWNEDVLKEKLKKIATVISSVENGKGPDILAVQEVENIALLQRLIDEFLPGLNYTAYLIENKDARGIDIGVISRVPLKGTPSLVSLGGSRPALNIIFELPDKNTLNLFSVHFPMASSPLEKRLSMLKQLTNASQKTNGFNIAMGDFNFPTDDKEASNLVEDHLLPYWIPVHLYCTDCQGTTYETFTKQWSFLDMILLNPNFFDKNTSWTADISSLQVYHPLDFQTNKFGSPADFTLPYKSGVSDHWPLLIQIVKTN
ncbi:endonuclease/exonuclease/phosphatase family protein [bacterium]|nr:endonuclease/exonuclease/phosphatase family protein [bacterium]